MPRLRSRAGNFWRGGCGQCRGRPPVYRAPSGGLRRWRRRCRSAPGFRRTALWTALAMRAGGFTRRGPGSPGGAWRGEWDSALMPRRDRDAGRGGDGPGCRCGPSGGPAARGRTGRARSPSGSSATRSAPGGHAPGRRPPRIAAAGSVPAGQGSCRAFGHDVTNYVTHKTRRCQRNCRKGTGFRAIVIQYLGFLKLLSRLAAANLDAMNAEKPIRTVGTPPPDPLRSPLRRPILHGGHRGLWIAIE